MSIDYFFNKNFLFCSKAYKINIIAAVMLITTGFLYSAPVITLQDEISNKKNKCTFYGIPIKENSKVLFVVDCSASMKEKASKSRNKNKLDVLRDELQAIVKQMNSDNQASGFAIVTFGSFSQRFPAVNLYSKNAILPALEARGETRMCKAWTLAVDVIQKEKIDTVYFLTDGNPSDRFRLRWLNDLLKQNKINNLTIHCICLGRNRQLMREIAAAYNGQYKYIR